MLKEAGQEDILALQEVTERRKKLQGESSSNGDAGDCISDAHWVETGTGRVGYLVL